MKPQKLELQLAHVEYLLKEVQMLKFDLNPKKKKHLTHLKELFLKIIHSDYKNFSTEDLDKTRQTLNYFLIWDLEFLLQSSDNSIVPAELLFCIETVLREWVDNSDEYIIVTSLHNKLYNYSIQNVPDEIRTILQPFIEIKFDFVFEYKLVLINLPYTLASDFLSNIALFHEIGHFIDKKHKIIYSLAENESNVNILRTLSESQDKFNKLRYITAINHYKEIFADLFAAQYIGNTLSGFINYFSHNQSEGFAHPSTYQRINKIDNFITNNKDNIIDIIQKYVVERTERKLEKRFFEISGNYADGKILVVTSNAELFSLFIKGWDCWLNSNDNFPRKLPLGLYDGYQKLNGLIKESICKFMGNQD